MQSSKRSGIFCHMEVGENSKRKVERVRKIGTIKLIRL
jgi:hypothetical protein